MRRIIGIISTLTLFVILFTPVQAYERNQARQVNEVVYGKIDSMRHITEQEMIRSEHSGWKTLAGAVVGGVIGHQFGGGRGREVATIVGSLAGAAVGYQPSQDKIVHSKLVELLIRTEKNKLVDVIQDFDPAIRFTRGDEVRILYFDDGVWVDRTDNNIP